MRDSPDSPLGDFSCAHPGLINLVSPDLGFVPDLPSTNAPVRVRAPDDRLFPTAGPGRSLAPDDPLIQSLGLVTEQVAPEADW